MPEDLDQELRRIALALIDSAPPPPPFPSSAMPFDPGPSRRRRIAAGMAMATVAAVAVAAVALSSLGSRPGISTLDVGQPVQTSTPGPTPTVAPTMCGDQPPKPIAVPESFTGPVAGPISAAPHPPEPGQLVLHWTSGAGGIELRWPMDPAVPNPFAPRPGSEGPMGSTAAMSGAILGAQPAGNGQTVRYMVISTGVTSPDPCRVLQLGVFDPDPARVQAIMDALSRAPYVSDAPLVSASRSADALPTVVLCNVPAGVAQTPNRSGGGDGMTYPSPTEALSAFLKGQPTLIPRGYIEIRLPDGSLAYGAQVRDGVFVTVIHVVPSPGGWLVARWEASGC